MNDNADFEERAVRAEDCLTRIRSHIATTGTYNGTVRIESVLAILNQCGFGFEAGPYAEGRGV